MNNIHTFRNFLTVNVSHKCCQIFKTKQGIRSSYPCRAIIFYLDNPRYNIENMGIYLKNEISSKINGAKSN